MKFINLTNRPITVQTTAEPVTMKSDGYCGFGVHSGDRAMVEGIQVTPEALYPVGVPAAQPGVMLIVPRDVRLQPERVGIGLGRPARAEQLLPTDDIPVRPEERLEDPPELLGAAIGDLAEGGAIGELVACCDVDEERARACARDFGIAQVADQGGLTITGTLLGSLIAYGLIGLASFISSFFGVGEGWGFYGVGGFGMLLCLAGVALASFSLALDFNMIEEGVRFGLPEKEAWRMAFGLTATLVWLYVEILRFLAIFANNRD